jgi:hypothetical protein
VELVDRARWYPARLASSDQPAATAGPASSESNRDPTRAPGTFYSSRGWHLLPVRTPLAHKAGAQHRLQGKGDDVTRRSSLMQYVQSHFVHRSLTMSGRSDLSSGTLEQWTAGERMKVVFLNCHLLTAHLLYRGLAAMGGCSAFLRILR